MNKAALPFKKIRPDDAPLLDDSQVTWFDEKSYSPDDLTHIVDQANQAHQTIDKTVLNCGININMDLVAEFI